MEINWNGFRLRFKDFEFYDFKNFDSKRYSDFEYWNEFEPGTSI